MIMDVYKISAEQYGYIIVVGSFVSVFGIFIYQTFLKNFEFRHLSYASLVIGIFLNTVSLMQAFRLNLKVGISDFTTLCFSGIIFNATNFALEILPGIVMA